MTLVKFVREHKIPAILAGLCVVLILLEVFDGYTIDDWWIIASGQYIAGNGIPYDNPFVPDGFDISIVIQQWLYCVMLSLGYDVGAWAGVAAVQLVFDVVAVASLWFLAKGISSDKPETLLLTAAGVFLCSMSYIWRPHALTVACLALVLGLLERYRRSDDFRYLLVCPFIVIFHVNVHASLAVFDVFFMLVYACPFFKKAKWSLDSSYRRLPVLATTVLSALALLVNPYGLDGALYIFTSLGSASYGGVIKEMRAILPPAASEDFYALAMITAITVIAAHHVISIRQVDVPAWVFWIIGSLMTLMAIRNLMFLMPGGILLVARALTGKWRKFRSDRTIGAVFLALAGFFVVSVVFMYIDMFAPDEYGNTHDHISALSSAGSESESQHSPKECVQAMEELGAGEGDPVLTAFYNGGYLELCGYKVTADARPELWDEKITKKEGFRRYKDYVDAVYYMKPDEGEAYAREKLVATSESKWAIVQKRDETMVAALDGSDGWERVYESDTNILWKNEAYEKDPSL